MAQIAEGNSTVASDGVDHPLFPPLLPTITLPRWVPLLLWALYVGFLLVVVLWFRSIGNMNVETDFYWTYVPVARSLLAGKLVLDAFRGPGYEIFLAIFRLITGDFFRAGVLLSVSSAGVCLLLLYDVVRRTYGSTAALLASALTALSPNFFSLAYTAGTDMFFVMLALSVLSLILRSDFTRGWLLLLAGLLAGLTYLTRYNGIAVVLAAGTGILWLCDPSRPWKQRMGSLALFLAGVAIPVVPFSIYTHQVMGKFIYNENYLNVAYGVFGKGRIRWDDFWQAIAPNFRSYADVIAYDPWQFIQYIGMNFLTHAWKDITQLVLWPIGIGAVACAIVMVRNGLTRTHAIVWLFAALSFLVLLPVFYTERFALLLLPFVVLLFVRFLQWKGIPKLSGRWHRYAAVGIGVIVAVWGSFQSANGLKWDVTTEPREILMVRDAFAGLAGDVPRGTSIAARKPHIAYYLGLDYIPFPYVTSEADLVTSLRRGNVDYTYISFYEIATRPELQGLLNSTQPHDGLRPLITVISPPSVLYRVVR